MSEREVDILEFPANVRMQPAMYIGDRETSAHILREIIDNSIDESLDKNSTCDTIDIFVQDKEDEVNSRWFCVVDNGRGIPLKASPKKPEMTMARLAVSSLHAGSNFLDNESKENRTSVGQNGVGSAVTNAVCFDFIVLIDTKRQSHNIPLIPEALKKQKVNDFYYIHFQKGILKTETFISREVVDNLLPFKLPTDIGTCVAFRPDTEELFVSTKFDPIKNLKYVQPFILKVKKKKLNINLNGKPFVSDWKEFKYSFHSSLESDYEKNRQNIIKKNESNPDNPIPVPRKARNSFLEFFVSFQITNETVGTTYLSGSVNGLDVKGNLHTHLVNGAFNECMNRLYGFNFKGKASMGMSFDVMVSAISPEFNSQTKETLVRLDGFGNGEISSVFISEFTKVIKSNKADFDKQAERIKTLLSTMDNLAIKDLVSAKVPTSEETRRHRAELSKITKLTDCSSPDRLDRELFVTEGDSAGNPIVMARDPRYHAVFRCRGKVKNVTGKGIKEVLNNEELKNLLVVSGAGTKLNPDISSSRYGKYIIAADADADGKNIVSLILSFYAQHQPHLIEAGMVYVLVSPLFIQDNKPIYDQKDLNSKKPFKRFKGLGSLNRDELRKFILNDEYRYLIQVTMGGIEEAIDITNPKTKGKKNLMIDYGVVVEDALTASDIDYNNQFLIED